MNITKAEFSAYFEAKKKEVYTCPFCGSQHFDIAQTFRGNPAQGQIQFVPDPGLVHQVGYHSYYAIICMNCGRADFFNAPTVDHWIAGNRPASLINSTP